MKTFDIYLYNVYVGHVSHVTAYLAKVKYAKSFLDGSVVGVSVKKHLN